MRLRGEMNGGMAVGEYWRISKRMEATERVMVELAGSLACLAPAGTDLSLSHSQAHSTTVADMRPSSQLLRLREETEKRRYRLVTLRRAIVAEKVRNPQAPPCPAAAMLARKTRPACPPTPTSSAPHRAPIPPLLPPVTSPLAAVVCDDHDASLEHGSVQAGGSATPPAPADENWAGDHIDAVNMMGQAGNISRLKRRGAMKKRKPLRYGSQPLLGQRWEWWWWWWCCCSVTHPSHPSSCAVHARPQACHRPTG